MKAFTVLTGCLMATALFASADKQKWENHKAGIKKEPGLLRYYTFEEGYGEEVANQGKFEKGKIAISGGPQGSLYIVRSSPYGITRKHYVFDKSEVPSPEWTQGRWPWKAALTNGLQKRDVFRSGITGKDILKKSIFKYNLKTLKVIKIVFI